MTRTICSEVSTRLFLFSSTRQAYIFFFFCFFISKFSSCSSFLSFSLSLYLLLFFRLPTDDVNLRVGREGDRRSLACSISVSLYRKLTFPLFSNVNTSGCIFSFRDLSGGMRKTSENYSYLITWRFYSKLWRCYSHE